jgi:hypothetical protein
MTGETDENEKHRNQEGGKREEVRQAIDDIFADGAVQFEALRDQRHQPKCLKKLI